MAPTPPAQAGAQRAGPGCGAPAEPPRPALGRPRSRTNNVRLGGTKAAGLGLLNTSEARRAAQFIGLGEKIIKNPPKNKGGKPAGRGRGTARIHLSERLYSGLGAAGPGWGCPGSRSGTGSGGVQLLPPAVPEAGVAGPPPGPAAGSALSQKPWGQVGVSPLFPPPSLLRNFGDDQAWPLRTFLHGDPGQGLSQKRPGPLPPAFPRARGSLRPTSRVGGVHCLSYPPSRLGFEFWGAETSPVLCPEQEEAWQDATIPRPASPWAHCRPPLTFRRWARSGHRRCLRAFVFCFRGRSLCDPRTRGVGVGGLPQTPLLPAASPRSSRGCCEGPGRSVSP